MVVGITGLYLPALLVAERGTLGTNTKYTYTILIGLANRDKPEGCCNNRLQLDPVWHISSYRYII